MRIKGKMLDEHNNIRGLQGGATNASGVVTEAYHLTLAQVNGLTDVLGNSIEIVNDLTTGGADKALSAEQGKVLNNSIDTKVQAKYDEFGHWGIAYTIDTYDSDDNPTQITFADGVVLTLTYNSDGKPTQAVYTKNSVTLKTATFTYDSNDRLTSYSLA